MQGVMGVGRDDHFDAALLAHPQINIGQVEPIGIGVALHSHAVFRGGVQHFPHVVIERLAP